MRHWRSHPNGHQHATPFPLVLLLIFFLVAVCHTSSHQPHGNAVPKSSGAKSASNAPINVLDDSNSDSSSESDEEDASPKTSAAVVASPKPQRGNAAEQKSTAVAANKTPKVVAPNVVEESVSDEESNDEEAEEARNANNNNAKRPHVDEDDANEDESKIGRQVSLEMAARRTADRQQQQHQHQHQEENQAATLSPAIYGAADCSSRCTVSYDRSLADCWSPTLAHYERVLVGLLRRYVTVQTNRAIWLSQHAVTPDFERMAKESLTRLTAGAPPPRIRDANKPLDAAHAGLIVGALLDDAERCARAVIEDGALAPHALECPHACERRWDPFMWLFAASALITCVLGGSIAAIAITLERREQKFIHLENEEPLSKERKRSASSNPLNSNGSPGRSDNPDNRSGSDSDGGGGRTSEGRGPTASHDNGQKRRRSGGHSRGSSNAHRRRTAMPTINETVS